MRPDFNLKDCYKLFDNNNKGYFDDKDLQSIFTTLNLYFTDEEIQLFYKRYRNDLSEQINEEDFINKFIPFEDAYREILNSKLPS